MLDSSAPVPRNFSGRNRYSIARTDRGSKMPARRSSQRVVVPWPAADGHALDAAFRSPERGTGALVWTVGLRTHTVNVSVVAL